MILFFEQNLLQNLVLLLHAYKSHQRQGRERKSAWIIENLLFEKNDQHVQLSVTYVLDPYEKMVNVSQVQVSKH